jgi:hypothetical protein
MGQFSMTILAVAGSNLSGNQQLWTYNNDRPNMGIGGITPAMKLKMAT